MIKKNCAYFSVLVAASVLSLSSYSKGPDSAVPDESKCTSVEQTTIEEGLDTRSEAEKQQQNLLFMEELPNLRKALGIGNTIQRQGNPSTAFIVIEKREEWPKPTLYELIERETGAQWTVSYTFKTDLLKPVKIQSFGSNRGAKESTGSASIEQAKIDRQSEAEKQQQNLRFVEEIPNLRRVIEKKGSHVRDNPSDAFIVIEKQDNWPKPDIYELLEKKTGAKWTVSYTFKTDLLKPIKIPLMRTNEDKESLGSPQFKQEGLAPPKKPRM